jgi:hypothetical protein
MRLKDERREYGKVMNSRPQYLMCYVSSLTSQYAKNIPVIDWAPMHAKSMVPGT